VKGSIPGDSRRTDGQQTTAGGDAQVLPGQALPRAVGSEELAHSRLVGARPRVARGHTTDQLEVAKVARRHAIVVALAEEGEHLQGPRADAGNSAQPPPSRQRVVGEQVRAPGRHLGRRPPQRDRPGRREVHRR